MNAILVNWETSTLGVLQFLAILIGYMIGALDGNPETPIDWSAIDWNVLFASLATLVGLLRARDAVKSSQDSGIRKEVRTQANL